MKSEQNFRSGGDEPLVVEASDLYDSGFTPGAWPHFLSYGGHRYALERLRRDREGDVYEALYTSEDGVRLTVLND